MSNASFVRHVATNAVSSANRASMKARVLRCSKISIRWITKNRTRTCWISDTRQKSSANGEGSEGKIENAEKLIDKETSVGYCRMAPVYVRLG